MVRVAFIGLSDDDSTRVENVLRACGTNFVAQCFSWDEGELAGAQCPALDLAIIRGEPADLARLAAVWPDPHRRPTLFVAIDGWNERRVQAWMNAGAERVFSHKQLAETLPGAWESWLASRVDVQGAEAPQAAQTDGERVDRRIEALITPRSFLRRLMGSLAAVVVIIDAAGKILYLNPQGEQLFGYRFEDVRERKFRDLFLLPEEEAEVMQVFEDLRNNAFPSRHQNSWINRSGGIVRLEWTNTVLTDEANDERYVLAVGLDISAEYQRLLDLQASESMLGRLFAANPIGMAVLGYSDGRVLSANQRFRDFFQRDEEDLKKATLVELGLLPRAEDWREEVLPRVQQQPFVCNERKMVLWNGQLRFARLSFSAVDLTSGPGVLVTVVDQSERLAGEEQARRLNEELEGSVLARSAALAAVNRELKSEVAFRKALEFSTQRLIQILWETPDVVAIVDLGGQLQYLNKAGRQLLGVNETDPVSSLSIYSLYSEDFRQTLTDEIAAQIAAQGVWRGETDFHLPDGRVIPVSQVIIGQRDDQGQVQYLSSVARDITELNRAARELRQAYEKERELGRLRDSFFSMTSHQFRTPLSAILSSAELIELYGQDWPVEKRRVHTQRIQNAAIHLSDLLNDILEYSRVEARQAILQPEGIELEGLCLKVINELRTSDEDQHKFLLDCTGEPCVAYSDRPSLERVMENILSNAIKYSANGTDIRVHIEVEDGGAVLRVQDEGIGISEIDQEMIFAPFYRGSNVMDMPGSGLGLMIVRKSLELIRGEIGIRSALGKGTEVTVRIPDLRKFIAR